MWTLSYRPELDGLRAVAVYLVLLFHAHMVWFRGGFIGVDVFFVLSGFLVTGVLMRDFAQRDRGPRAILGQFYARRVRRLLPAAAVVVAMVALLQMLIAGLPARIEMVDDARASLLYFANWHFILEGRDYFAGAEGASPYLHFWSLSIEEQFYIVYPLLFLLAVRRASRPILTLGWGLGVVGLVSVLLQVWVARTDINLAYYGTHTRVYQLAAGALLMVLVHAWTTRERQVPPRAAAVLALVGLAGIVVVASDLVDVSQSNRGLLATVFSVLTIAGLWWSPRGPLSRLLASGIPRYLGQISYGTYLWHWPVTLVLGEVFDIRPLVLSVLTALVATGLAALSFEVLEMPIRRGKRMRQMPWRLVGAALACSVALAVALGPALLERDARPALAAPQNGAGTMSPELDRPVPAGLDLVAAKEDVGPRVPPCTTDDPDACTMVTGGGQHVVLVGDSQGRMLAPALVELAEKNDLTLSVHVMQGCAWQVDQDNERDTPGSIDNCRDQRRGFYEDVLPQLDADVVITMGLSRSDDYWRTRLTSPSSPDGEESLEQMQLRTTTLTADLVEEAGADLVIVRSVLGTDGYTLNGFDPLECLAAARKLGDCAVPVPVDQPSVDATYVNLALTRDSVSTIDLNPLICPDAPLCAPVIGDQVVWKDRNHVTASLLVDRADRIWEQLQATGAMSDSR